MSDQTPPRRSRTSEERVGKQLPTRAPRNGRPPAESGGGTTPPPTAGRLIGSIVVTPPNPRPAESVRVEVRSPAGALLDGPDVRVMINGVPGAMRYLQFARPGRRRLKVLAVAGELAERQLKLVDVAGEPVNYQMARALAQPSMLLTQQTPGQPHEVTLGLGLLPVGGRREQEASRSRPDPAPRIAAAPTGEPDGQEPALETSYEWDFGDGTSAVTAAPTVSHDYFDAIDHARGYGSFHVRCRARHSDQESIRTLTVYSAYTACRRLGAVVPRVKADIFAEKRFTMLSGTLRVTNVEDVPLTLEKLALTPLGDDPHELALRGRLVELERPIEVAARSTSVIAINVPITTGRPEPGQLRYDVGGFTALYTGRAGALPVRVSATFEVRAGARDRRPVQPAFATRGDAAWPWGSVARTLDERLAAGGRSAVPRSAVTLDPATGSVAVSLAQVERGADPAQVRASIDRILGTIFEPAIEAAPEPGKSGPKTAQQSKPGAGPQLPFALALDGPPAPGPVAAGQVCDPDNISDDQRERAEAGHLVCQRTDETVEVLMPARFMNARKGDIILSPGGPGLIGGLLRGVDPPQLYSHSGIMTRNYDEVTHSTASEERMIDHTRGLLDGSQGFEPDALKYMWPGVIAQPVEAAIHGEPFADPETGKQYRVSSFEAAVTGLTVEDEMVIIPPLVVKPDPLEETEAVRAALHAVAAEARTGAGRPGVNSKSHYRLYCYTDPTIGETERAPASAGWAAGTFGSVCSSYIWLMHRRHGSHFEAPTAHPLPTDLELADVRAGATVDPGHLDGLYAYTAEERLAVGEWLFETLHDEVRDKAGWFGELMTDAANDLANQMINTFATDDADAKDSRKWREVGPATAVSPDNLLWWDGPDGDGLYGYAEPLIYREPRRETYTVSRWKQVLVSGRLSGRITDDTGSPVAGALVQVYDGKSAHSGSDGRYELADVPFGKYELRASSVIDGFLYAAQVTIDLQAASRVVDVRLAPPAARYRRAQIHLNAWGIDGDTLKDDIADPGPEYKELELGPDRPLNTLSRAYEWGGECRMEWEIVCRLLVNNSLDVEVKGRLYEGTKETTDKEVGNGSKTFTVAPDESGTVSLTVETTDWLKKDECRLTVTVVNALNTN